MNTGFIGGIVGSINTEVEISNCYNNGTITAGGQCSGGIAGSFKAGTIVKCYNIGKVEAKAKAKPTSRGIAGGIVAANQGGTISEVYNSENVTIGLNTQATNNNAGGGIVGVQTAGSIEKAYNKGNILGEGETKGAVVGQKTGGELSKTYFYSQINNASINGIGTTTSSKDINTQLSPVSTAEGEVESTTANYTSLNDFLKNIQ